MCMTTMTTYNDYDRRYGRHKRPCIDGKVTGSCNCVGYCEYEIHPGFLTEQLRKSHRCIENGCIHYREKQVTENIPQIVIPQRDMTEELLCLANHCTAEFEGMKFIRVAQTAYNCWTAYYVAISDYALNRIEQHISERTGVDVTFQRLNYKYDIAAKLIFSEA